MVRRSSCGARTVGAVLSVIACLAPYAHAAGVSYSNVADTTTTAPGHGAFNDFDFNPSLSGSNVAFRGQYAPGSGIYTGTVSATGATKIVETGDIAPGYGVAFTGFSNPAVSGTNLAFRAGSTGASGGSGIYTGTVGTAGSVKLVDFNDTAPGHTAFNGFSEPSISGSNVAYFGIYSTGRGVYTSTVGGTGAAKIADTSDTAPGHGVFTSFNAPSVGGSTVAVVSHYTGGSGIYTGTVGTAGLAKIVDTSDTAPGHGVFTGFNDPSVSGNNVAFFGAYSGGAGIYTATVGTTGATKLVEFGDTAPGHGAFTSLGDPVVSGGNVVFGGGYSGGGGIYLATAGAGGSLSALLNTGDPLFGSTLTSFSLGNSAYDSDPGEGAITFWYQLANGRVGVGVVNVPEPAALSFLAAGAAATLLRRQRQVS